MTLPIVTATASLLASGDIAADQNSSPGISGTGRGVRVAPRSGGSSSRSVKSRTVPGTGR